MNKADTAVASAKVEAYAIPEGSSTSTRHRDTIRDYYGQGTSSSEAAAPASDGNDAERAERGGRSKSRANLRHPSSDGLPSDHTADSAMEDAVNVGNSPCTG